MILALDLDGTLLRTDKTISERTGRALDEVQSRGHRIIIATARPPRSTEQLLGERVPEAPRVYYSGSLVTLHGKRIRDRTIPIPDAQAILSTFASSVPEGVPIYYEIDDRLYANQPLDPGPGVTAHDIVDLTAPLRRAPVKIVLDITRIDDPYPILDNLPESVRYVIADGVIAMITCSDVNKASGIEVILEHWGESFDQVIAIGDDLSDLDMIERAAIGIAMINGHDKIKAIADRIAPSNDEDGVAFLVEQMIEEGLLA